MAGICRVVIALLLASVPTSLLALATRASEGSVNITGPDGRITKVKHSAFRPAEPSRGALRGFVEVDGYVSIEAEQYTHKDDSGPVGWQKMDDYDAPCPRRRYFLSRQKARCHVSTRRDSNMRCTCSTPAKVEVEAIVAPTLNVVPGRGLRYAIFIRRSTSASH